MTDVRRLAKFTISQEERGFMLHLEDDAGGKIELWADDDQLDRIIDELDDALNGPPIEDGD